MKQWQLSNKLLLTLFFFSGMTGLIYQMSWIRIASDIFGSTLAALSSVTAIFFGGMALGSWLIARTKRTLTSTTYAHIEILLALSALLSIVLFIASDTITSKLFASIYDKTALFTLTRLLLLALTIGPAALFSGATFPIMVAILKSNEGHLAQTGAQAYTSNSLGAVVGALLAGLVLIPFIGIVQSIYFGVAINLVIAATLLKSTLVTLPKPEETTERLTLWPTGLLFFGIGFVGMATEMIWGRFLSLIIHNTVYISMIAISMVILGLALGALIVGKQADRFTNRSRVLGLTILGGLTSLLIVLFLPAKTWQSLATTPWKVITLASIGMFIPALFSGMSFPLALRLVTTDGTLRGKGAGFLNALNTTGGILGSLLTGLILVPIVGLLHTIYIIAAVQFSLALFALLQDRTKPALYLLLLLPIIPMALGFTSSEKFMKSYLSPKAALVYLNEGRQSSVTVTEKDNLKTMEIDRMWQGENRPTRQIMAAHVPMMLKAGAVPNILTIGVGPGVTASRFLMYNVDSLHLVDIEPAVFEAAEAHFDAGWMSSDPRVTKIVADGRQYMHYTESMYDLISVEIGQVFRPHSAQFYTEDFYKQAAMHMNPEALICQFLPVASFDTTTFKTVIRTFMNTFPKTQLWYNRSEFLLIGAQDSIYKLNPMAMVALQEKNSELEKDLFFSYWGGNAYKLTRPEVFAGGYLMNEKRLKAFVGEGPIYTNNKPTLEYYAARNKENPPVVGALDSYLGDPFEIFPPAKEDKVLRNYISGVRNENLTSVVGEALIRAYFSRQDPALLLEAEKYNPNNLLLNSLLGDFFFSRKEYKKAIIYLDRITYLEPADLKTLLQVSLAYIQDGQLSEAGQRLNYILEKQPNNYVAYSYLGFIYATTGQTDNAIKHFEKALTLSPDYPQAKENLARLYAEKRQKEQNEN